MRGFDLTGWEVVPWNPRPLPHERESLRARKDGMVLSVRVMQREGGPVYAQATLVREKPPLSRGLTSKVLARVLASRWLRLQGRDLWVAVVPGGSS